MDSLSVPNTIDGSYFAEQAHSLCCGARLVQKGLTKNSNGLIESFFCSRCKRIFRNYFDLKGKFLKAK